MILGVDHISKSVIDLSNSQFELESLGYSCKFRELGIPNPAAKQDLLKYYESTHDIAFFTHPETRINIELIHQGKRLSDDVAKLSLEEDGLKLSASKPEEEIRFWSTILKFKEENSTTLVLNSPFKQARCRIEIVETLDEKEDWLDNKGYSCLALLTSNVHAHHEKLKQSTPQSLTPIFELQVNKNKLQIFMFRTPSGIIVELIQIKR